ncbi:MAG TPA: zinc ribbon domain-containing protein [Firmicutes bacterium]|nr:zinc ribbon domain-containing protein [Bacillota bacterium]
MAMYDMRCRNCGEKFSLFCSWEEMKEAKCPKCGSDDVTQVYGSVAVLGGSGSSSSRSSASSSPSRKFG